MGATGIIQPTRQKKGVTIRKGCSPCSLFGSRCMKIFPLKNKTSFSTSFARGGGMKLAPTPKVFA
jgi:hypothetical protein